MKLFNQHNQLEKTKQNALLKASFNNIRTYNNPSEKSERELKNLCQEGLLHILLKLGVFNKTYLSIDKHRESLGIIKKYDRLFEELILSQLNESVITTDNSVIKLANGIESKTLNFNQAKEVNNFINQNPSYEAHAKLLDTCLNGFIDILKGKRQSTEILFPGGSLEMVNKIYKGNYQSDYFNDLIADIIEESVTLAIKDLKENQKISILEVGAGTGGTSEVIFKKLLPFKNHIEYWYTDISKSFLLYAQENFLSIAPYIKTAIFNIEEFPKNDELKLGSFDLILATNVIHATKDVAKSLGNIKPLLKNNGIILLNEISQVELFNTLTFGLLDGWWLYEDEEIRIQGSPGLSSNNWKTVLTEKGFLDVLSFPENHKLSQQIIYGKSDGLIENRIIQSSSLTPKNNPLPTKTVYPIKPQKRNDLIDKVLKIAADTIKLPKEEFDKDVNFTDYGFDSILATTLVKNINESLNVLIKPTDIFNYPNLSLLSEYIDQNFLIDDSQKEVIEPLEKTDLSIKSSPILPSEKNQRFYTDTEKSVNISDIRLDDIAIIGMSGQFGSANDLFEFRKALEEGKSLIREVPSNRWSIADYFSENKKEANKTYSKWGSFLNDIDVFDPLFFKISGNDAEMMDPQQRFFLVHCWKAIEDAGINPQTLKASKCGVYVGVGPSDYLPTINDKSASAFWGNSSAILASRISYYLDLKGPAIAVDTACSSSLVAIDMAYSSLQKQDTDIAIAGGVAIMNSPNFYILASRAGMLSADGKCYTFDQRANGFVPGEGVGVIVMKRLKDAQRDNDQIYGIIKGSLTNQDGTTNGITAPSSLSQTELEKNVYHKFNINPETITYVEAHGTGTSLGDPIEFEALNTSFSAFTSKQNFCSIGSVKTNIGHALTAAGVASVVKVLLSLKHKTLFPSINFNNTNPLIDFNKSPFRLQEKVEFWQHNEHEPRRAAISSFGFSGTNAHLVIEEYISEPKPQRLERQNPVILTLSAKDEDVLKDYIIQLQGFISNNIDVDLNDLAYTLQIGRESMQVRLAIVTYTIDDLKAKIQLFLDAKQSREVFYGNTKKETLNFILDGEAGLAYLNKAIETKEFSSLAQLWAKGLSIEWAMLYENTQLPSKISIPTYPFAKERYWLPMSEKNTVTAYKQIHPLLHENKSTLYEQKFISIFSGKEPFLSQHRVNNAITLPAAALIELAREATESSTNTSVSIFENLSWLRPIQADNGSFDLSISLKSIDSNIHYEVYTSTDKTLNHSGTISLNQAVVSEKNDIETIKSQLKNHQDKKFIYDLFEENGLYYGEKFQGIHCIYYDKTTVLSEIEIPNDTDYELNPYLLDCVLQSCVGFSFDNQNTSLFVPYSIKKMTVYDKPTSKVWAYVKLYDVTSTHARAFDIDVMDSVGNILIKIESLLLVSVVGKPKNSALQNINENVKNGITFYKNEWESVPETAINESQDEPEQIIILAGASIDLVEKIRENIEVEVENIDNQIEEVFFESCFTLIQRRIKTKSPLNIIIVYQNDNIHIYSFIIGLLKTAMLENPLIKAKTLGVEALSIKNLHTLTQIITNEYRTPQTEVRYINEKREAKILKEVIIEDDKSHNLAIKSGGVYLIIGGLGGIGKKIIEYLAVTTSVKVIIAGRSEPNALQEIWMQEQKIYRYYQCDIAQKSEVNNLINEIKNDLQEINGIIHCAGLTNDSLIINKSSEQTKNVLAAKVRGVINLDEATQKEKIDFMVFFSSLSSIFGNIGQADYASANAFLDSFANYREKLKNKGIRYGKTISINWPFWKEGGMLLNEDSLKYIENKTGLKPMDTELGLEAFIKVLNFNENQIIIFHGSPQSDNQVNKTSYPKAIVENINTTDFDEHPNDRVIAFFTNILAQEFKIPEHKIELDVNFDKYGIDSVLITQISNRLDEYFDSVPRTLFFEYQNLGDIIQYFSKNYPKRINEILGERFLQKNIEPTPIQLQLNENKGFKDLYTKPSTHPIASEDIAIIGISGRYPGADNLEEFWNNLSQGKDSISEIPFERWDLGKYFDEEKGKKGKIYSKWGGFINNIDKFDPLFFNISPREAALIDPQERLFLEIAWEAIEDAGYSKTYLQSVKEDGINSQKVGVYVGVMYEEYQLYGVEQHLKGNFINPTSSPSSIANRVSYTFNFQGPSIAIDTMCSSSITALYLACKDLISGETDYAIAGGVNLSIHPNKYLLLSQGRFVSSKGRCESFGEGGEGYVPAEGLGAVVLKPLNKAKADADNIYGIIKACSINHDGRTNGYSVPNPNAQSAVIKDTFKKAGILPEDVSYVEAHGTGTFLGDPIEIAGLTKAFNTDKKQFCSIGSVKSNIGHCESAAGISGLTKVLLQMKYKQLVPSLHSQSLNPNINFESTPFKVQQKLESWTTENNKPLIAGISSFGAGGSNAHLILQSYEQTHTKQTNNISPSPCLIIISAKNKDRLSEQVKRMIKFTFDNPKTSIHDIAFTLCIGREQMEERIAMVVSTIAELSVCLNDYLKNEAKNIITNKDISSLNPEATPTKIADALKTKNLYELANYWVLGKKIDWEQLYMGANTRRISLPTYPFEDGHYWLPTIEGVTLPIKNKNKLNPLLHYLVETPQKS